MPHVARWTRINRPELAASEPHGIAVGPDGAVWAALETGSIAHLTPAAPRERPPLSHA
ncbi:MAG TPA: hypothetical protein VFV41_07895 [Streptosporangiaceae bacterium]|nr:hypothetical protein [Streptosporangiaceae bacterium]